MRLRTYKYNCYSNLGSIYAKGLSTMKTLEMVFLPAELAKEARNEVPSN